MKEDVKVKKKSKEYLAGYDSGIHGANEINCHFSLFSTPEKTKEWEKGRKDADLLNIK